MKSKTDRNLYLARLRRRGLRRTTPEQRERRRQAHKRRQEATRKRRVERYRAMRRILEAEVEVSKAKLAVLRLDFIRGRLW